MLKTLKREILNINNFFLRPFYRGVEFWPFNAKFIKYPINKQIVLMYNKLFSKYYNEKQIINLTMNKGVNFIMYCQGNKGSVEMDLIIGGEYEPKITNYFINNIKNSDIFVDIGSNIGYYAILAAKLLNNKSKIVCFEPIKETYSRLQENIEINGLKNTEALNIALGEKDQIKTIHLDKDLGHNSLAPINQSKTKEQQSICVKKLDNILKARNKNICIKIDVEGYEYEVLKGMSSLLKNNKCKIIFEFSPIFYKSLKYNSNNCHEIKILNLLKSLNFNIYELNHDKLSHIVNVKKFIKNKKNVEQVDLFAKTNKT